MADVIINRKKRSVSIETNNWNKSFTYINDDYESMNTYFHIWVELDVKCVANFACENSPKRVELKIKD